MLRRELTVVTITGDKHSLQMQNAKGLGEEFQPLGHQDAARFLPEGVDSCLGKCRQQALERWHGPNIWVGISHRGVGAQTLHSCP